MGNLRKTALILTCSLAYLLGLGNALVADPVALFGVERGQGYMFQHQGNCYVVTALHVTSARGRAQIITEGADSGGVSMRSPFWPEMDLAIGIVRGGATEGCDTPFNTLSQTHTQLAQDGQGVLVLVNEQGQVSRVPMRVSETRHLDFDARFVDANERSLKGMSGGFLFINQIPVGMALNNVEESGGTEIRFLRIEEISMNVGRWLASQGGQNFGTQPVVGAGDLSGDTGSGLQLRLVEAKTIARSPDELAENVLNRERPYVFAPNGPMELVFEIQEGDRPELSRVKMSAAESDDTVVPRQILIMVNASKTGGRWRRFWSGDMPADGILDTGVRAPAWAKRVKIFISSAWGEGDVRLDWIGME